MDTSQYLVVIQLLTAIITLISVFLIYLTIKNNTGINQNNLFNEVIKQERDLRIRLNEYRLEIDRLIDAKKDIDEIALMYDTLLFNYYEYLAVCVNHKMVREEMTRKYFKPSIIFVSEAMSDSTLFKKGFSKINEYPYLMWLFNKWDISHPFS